MQGEDVRVDNRPDGRFDDDGGLMARRRGVVRLEAPSLRTSLAAAGIGLAGVVALALTFTGPRTPPDYTPPSSARGTASPGAPAGEVPSGASTGFGTVAVVIGDGLSTTPSADAAFACSAAVQRGWRCASFAAAGSGYVTKGSAGRYADQLAKAATVDGVGVVVVSGGGVDRSAPAAAARTAVESLVRAARLQYPGATVVLVPPFGAVRGSPGLAAIRAALAASANGDDVVLADGARWFAPGTAVLGPDGLSLSPAATEAAVTNLAAALPPPAAG